MGTVCNVRWLEVSYKWLQAAVAGFYRTADETGEVTPVGEV